MEPVSSSYRHRPKQAAPGPGMELPGARLKWYDIHPPEAPIPREIQGLARDCLAAQLRLEGDIGFVILHRCGADFYFLIVGTWRNDNELWESVYTKDGAAPAFAPFTPQGRHRPTFCIWELGPVVHERLAWTRYLESARDEGARRAYLEDRFNGPV